MNPYNIYNLWTSFNQLMDDPNFNTEELKAMGEEMLKSLPPEMLCSSSKSTLNAIETAMKSRLTRIGINNGRSASKEEEPASPSPSEDVTAGNKRPSKKPLRKDAAN